MKTIVDIPEYNPEDGIVVTFDAFYSIKVEITDDFDVLVSANKNGLLLLAKYLLTLAQDSVPTISGHFHLTEHDDLEKESSDLIVQKTEDLLMNL